MESGNPLLDDHVLALSGARRPKVCFLPTASGDADHYVVRFYRAFGASRCEPSHISLFRRETGVGDPRTHLLEQDVIYVGGGMAGRGASVRRLGRLAVLVSRRCQLLSRGRGATGGGAGVPALQQRRALHR